MNSDSKLAWGISLLIIGMMFLFRQMNLFSYAVEDFIFDWKNLIILLGVVFLLFHKKQRVGSIVMIAIGLFFYLKELVHWARLSDYIWPLTLLIAGGALVYSAIIKTQKQSESNQPSKKEDNDVNQPPSTLKKY